MLFQQSECKGSFFLNILQVSTSDILGGAEKVARDLFQAYRERGVHSWLAVGCKRSDDSDVFVIPNDEKRGCWARIWVSAGNVLSPLVGKIRGAGRLRSCIHLIGQPHRLAEVWRGHEDFDFPGTRKLLELAPERPDIIHCHNLHGGYFDLRVLSWLSKQVPVVLTLHDAWLLSGHCSYSFGCGQWKTGCGNCPDLGIYPPIKRDATACNWERKREIYARSRLYVATPSEWLMRKVERSVLAQAIVEAKVIPNGVDLTVFHPGNKRQARELLGIPPGARVLLFVGNNGRLNRRKGYAIAESAVVEAAKQFPGEKIILVCLGGRGKAKRIGSANVRFVGYETDAGKIAGYYQAADIHVSATRADNFPNTVLESLACGVPVVATRVGGIPEQVEDGMNGFLVPPGNFREMANRIKQLLCDDDLYRGFSARAVEDARKRFDLNRQVDDYLNWYEGILSKEKGKNGNSR